MFTFFKNLLNQQGFKNLNPDEFVERAQNTEGAILLDVRTTKEFDKSHLLNAVRINVLDKKTFDVETNALDKSKPIFVYCRSSRRSQMACEKLTARGFKQVFNMKGGLQDWRGLIVM